MNKILIISDSLGLPRTTPERVSYEDTYYHKIKSKFPNAEVFPFMLGGADVITLYNLAKSYLVAFEPDIVIIQSGIVDCAPRAFNRVEMKIISDVKFVNKIYNSRFKARFKAWGKARGLTNTSPEEYRKHIDKFVKLFPNSKIGWCSIVPATDEYEVSLPGITENIHKYNNLLTAAQGITYIDNSNLTAMEIMTDYHHLSSLGHSMVFENMLSSSLFNDFKGRS